MASRLALPALFALAALSPAAAQQLPQVTITGPASVQEGDGLVVTVHRTGATAVGLIGAVIFVDTASNGDFDARSAFRIPPDSATETAVRFIVQNDGVLADDRTITASVAPSYPTYEPGNPSSITLTVINEDAEAPPDPPSPPPPPRTPGGGGPPGGGGAPRTSAPGAPGNLTAEAGDGQAVLSWDAPASDGGTAITDYEYRINRSDPWIPTGSTETTHTVSGLVNGTVYVFEVRAVNAAGRSASSNRAEATPEVFTLDFAHFANGDGLTSDLVFVNVGTHPIRPALYFYDQEGQPMAAESVVDITGDLEVMEDGGLTVQTEMEPLGELTISTHGQGELVSGSVKVIAFGAIGGGLRFDLPEIGVAGVGASPPVRDAVFPVRRQEGGINTGVAIHNLESSPEIVRCELMRQGVLRDAVGINLAANGQSSWFIDAAFPDADTSGFVGSVRCDAEGPGQFTPPWPWNWMPPAASSPPCRCFRCAAPEAGRRS